jgi:hypothetical protein
LSIPTDSLALYIHGNRKEAWNFLKKWFNVETKKTNLVLFLEAVMSIDPYVVAGGVVSARSGCAGRVV